MSSIEIPKPNHSESSLVRASGNSLNGSLNKNIKNPTPEIKELKGGITHKDPSFREKLKRSFVKENLKDIGDYVFFDIIVPGIRKAIFDTIVGAAGQIFGVSVPSSVFRYSDGYNGNRPAQTQHERQYRDYSTIQRRNQAVPTLSTYDRFYVNDFPFTYKEDADSTLEQLMDICDTYGWVSVANFFQIADPKGTIQGRNVYTNNNFGWTSVDDAIVDSCEEGWVIILPPAKPRRMPR